MRRVLLRRLVLFTVGFIIACSHGFGQLDIKASIALVERILPAQAKHFKVESLNPKQDKDVFEIEGQNDIIILRGNNGVAVASALYYYLTTYCHCQVTWNGINLKLPDSLPSVPLTVRRQSPYNYRYYLNYCTFNYSMSWWDWERWEKEIDWMALHGINMPLAITGEEFTWYTVYKEMGFTEKDLQSFFCGPSYFSWFWMGNLDGWGGPLPLGWMKTHKLLQQKILQRERALGMKPVLPAFTGHVPSAFRTKFPTARLKATNWKNGFGDTYILDSEDPLFASIGKKFLETQTRLFGSDHLYSADTFNENEPPSADENYLARLSKRIYEGMKTADTQAVWVMQGWLFYSDRKFWKPPQIKALLDAVPNDRMILLDLAAEIEPVWKRTSAFYGKPWIWNMLHNFGGNISLFGRMDGVASGPASALADESRGQMKGIGLTMEGIEQNPVLYELLTSHTWQTEPIEINSWLSSYVLNRYGVSDSDALKGWGILRATVYNGKIIRDGAESIITGRPTFDSTTVWTRTKLNYDPRDLLTAWNFFVSAAANCKHSDGFRYDLVDVTRQVLANYANSLQKEFVNAYKNKDLKEFSICSEAFIGVITDMDTLLSTRSDFLLGRWISDARKCGHTPSEMALYERNARDLITLWGDANSPLHEYSCRQWSGLLSDFYKPRWTKFFKMIVSAMQSDIDPDLAAFDKSIKGWEWQWVNTQNNYPTEPAGNSVEVSKRLYEKYLNKIEAAYRF